MAVIKKESFQTWIGTAAEMAAFTGMLAGNHFITTDEKKEYTYTGAAWIEVNLIQLSGSNVVLGTQINADQSIAFANSALINTQVNVDFVKPTVVRNRYKLAFYNPSTITDLTVKLMSVALAFGGATRYDLIDTITIPKSQAITGTTVSAYAKFVEGLFVGGDLRLVISNNTVLGVADGFTGYIRAREV
jgi:hypothetical protein